MWQLKITTNFVTKFYPDITYLYILVFIYKMGGGIQILYLENTKKCQPIDV